MRIPRLVETGLAVALVALAASAYPALAEDFPARQITLVAPWPPGGAVDALCRALAPGVGDRLGRPARGREQAGRGLGDRYGRCRQGRARRPHTAARRTDAQLAAAGDGLRKSLPYDPIKDYVPIAFVGSTPFGLIVSSSLPAQSVTELIERVAKEQPGKISYGSSGAGGIPHLLGAELFMSMTGTK